jgi:hypothetical protein
METVIELSYWNIHCYTMMYVIFIIFVFLFVVRYLNRNDERSVSFFSFLVTSQKKDIMKNQLRTESERYEDDRSNYIKVRIEEQILQMLEALVRAISTSLSFPEFKLKIKAFRDRYKIY